jgi:glycosyltransferase involved in cell wall biosynthesis
MTIALDATYAVGENLSGVGLYSRKILLGLAAAHPEERFWYCFRPHRRFRDFGGAPPNARRRLLLDPLIPRGADLFHGLNQRLPKMRLRRSVATFHDLFVMTGEYSTREFRVRFTEQAREAAARADAIIAVSEFTKRQVVDLLGVQAAKVHVIHHGVGRVVRPAASVEELAVEREKLVLNVGVIQTRKNTARLVDAFESLDSSWRLAIIGSFGYGSEGIRARIEASPARGRILMPGYVAPGALAAWYARAAIFAFPSLDEGFGMPILEAMAAGAPVLTSDRSALPEVAGDAALLVDPNDTAALTAALRRLAEDEALRRDLAVRGLERALLFTWEKAVLQTWAVYTELFGT